MLQTGEWLSRNGRRASGTMQATPTVAGADLPVPESTPGTKTNLSYTRILTNTQRACSPGRVFQSCGHDSQTRTLGGIRLLKGTPMQRPMCPAPSLLSCTVTQCTYASSPERARTHTYTAIAYRALCRLRLLLRHVATVSATALTLAPVRTRLGAGIHSRRAATRATAYLVHT